MAKGKCTPMKGLENTKLRMDESGRITAHDIGTGEDTTVVFKQTKTMQDIPVWSDEWRKKEEDLIRQIDRHMKDCVNDLLHQVCEQCLGRPFQPEQDTHLFQLITHAEYNDRFGMIFKGNTIGMIYMNYGQHPFDFDFITVEPKSPSIGARFEPGEILFPTKP